MRAQSTIGRATVSLLLIGGVLLAGCASSRSDTFTIGVINLSAGAEGALDGFKAETLTVVTERPVSEALALTIRTVFITAGLIVAALLSAAVLGYYAVRKIIRPIRGLAATAQAIRASDLWQQAETTGQDELGVLGATFNRMTAQLRDMIESLEERVEERTKELSKTNTELETEVAERRRAEQTMRDTVQRLRALIQASPLPILNLWTAI